MVPEIAAVLLLAVGPELRPSILNEPHGSSLPATCNQGDTYILTSATTGRQQYTCESANTWVVQGDALGAGDPGANGFMARTGTNSTSARTLTFGLGLTATNADGVSGNPSINFNYAGTLAGNVALSAGQCVFDSSDGSGIGGLLCESSAANNGEVFIQIGATGTIADRTTIIPIGSSTTAINVPAIENSQTWTGTQTFSTIAAKIENVINHSDQYADIPTTIAATTNAAVIDPDENDTTSFGTVNPAGVDRSGTNTGKKDIVTVDLRGGHFKVVGSARAPWDGANAGSTRASAEDGVMIVKAQYRDKTDLFNDDDSNGTRDGDSWACGPDYKSCSTTSAQECVIDTDCPVGETCTGADKSDGPSCPGNFPTGGDTAHPDRLVDFWYGGHYNIDSNSSTGGMMGPGPTIFRVEGPDIDDGDGVLEAGESTSKPIFSVGLTGVGIYMPENYGDKYYSMFTVYRPNQGAIVGSSTLANTPFCAITKDGLMCDGATFFGNSNLWPLPNGAGNNYGGPNLFVHKDVANTDPGFVVEGANNNNASAEDGPIGCFQSWVNGTLSSDHRVAPTGGDAEALCIYENSRLRLASKCTVAGGSCSGTSTDSQIIEWEGMTDDANETRLGATDPTGDRDIQLPDASGTIGIGSGTANHGSVYWGVMTATNASFDTGTEVCTAAGLTCQTTADVLGVAIACGTAHTVIDQWLAFCK